MLPYRIRPNPERQLVGVEQMKTTDSPLLDPLELVLRT
jgi:hypothetical protein